MKDIRTILLTTDFSETSKEAFEPALTLAGKFGARIIVVYVDDDRRAMVVPDHVAVNLDLESIYAHQHELHQNRLAELVDAQFSGESKVTCEVPRGTPYVEIVRLANEREVDLIVMATHGGGFISHAILGSTTERVLRRAPCPVLVIKHSGAGSPHS
jgi:nucleotide-binding universal stress UspA family protein